MNQVPVVELVPVTSASAWSLDPFVIGVVLAMAAVTHATKVGGLWLLNRVDLSERVEAGLAALPGAIVIAILGPELAAAGPAGWAGAAVTLVVVRSSGSILLALVAGVGSVIVLRGVT